MANVRADSKVWRGRIVVVAVLVIGASGARAHADDAPQVEALIRQGVELRQDGKDSRALPLFQHAYELARTPRTAGQLGLCELALGYWIDAEKHLAESLASPSHPWIAKNQQALATSLQSARENIGQVVVEGAPTGAEVLVDGRAVGRLPLAGALRLPRGPHDVELRQPGYAPETKAVTVAGADTQRVGIALQKLAATPSSTPPGSTPGANPASLPNPAPAGSGAGAVPARGEPAAGPSAPGSGPGPAAGGADPGSGRTFAWVAAGVAGAAVVLGVVETFGWVDKQNQFDNHVGPLAANPGATGKNCGSDDSNFGGAGCRSLHDDVASARLLAFVGYGVGVAAGVAAAVLFATSHPAAPTTSTAMSCGPELPNWGLSCRVAF
jgi:hypothetical protein